MILKWLEKKWNQEHNKEMIELGRSWFPVVRNDIDNYKRTGNGDFITMASRHLSYAEDYLKLIKE